MSDSIGCSTSFGDDVIKRLFPLRNMLADATFARTPALAQFTSPRFLYDFFEGLALQAQNPLVFF